MTPTTRTDRIARNQAILDYSLQQNGGARDWRDFKASASRELIDLANRAPRVGILGLSLEGDLHAAYTVQMPVPRWPHSGRLIIGKEVVFHLMYQESWRWESPPSFLPLAITSPFDIFHPNCRPSALPVAAPGLGIIPVPGVMVCLGDLPPGTPPKEIMLLGYYAVTLQDRILDELDPKGVFNPAACAYYRDHPQYLPLTRTGLLDPWTPTDPQEN
jgi:hypothetical protein